MRATWIHSVAFMCALGAAWSAGVASANYPDAIPNGFLAGVGRCAVCHIDPAGGGTLTGFGSDFQRGADGVLGTSDDRRWSARLAARDSDGDLWTNGQELGDPFGVWTSGATPASTYRANPGSISSVPTNFNLCTSASGALNDCTTFEQGGTCTDTYDGSGRWACGCRTGWTGTSATWGTRNGHRRTTSHNFTTSGVRSRYTIVTTLSRGCWDLDECTRTPGLCGPGACSNREGTYRCTCNPGYAAPATGGTCTDINECVTMPGVCSPGACANTPGSYTCTCPSGYDFDGSGCVVTNACTAGTNDCHPQASCTPVGASGWTCTCRRGWRGIGTLASGTGDNCVDIDECAETPRVCGAGSCRNTAGSYVCTCPSGYRGQASGGTCVDIDECMEMPGVCDVGLCTNTAGSYTCRCPLGYRFEGGTCVDIDECVGNPCGAGDCVQSFPPPGYGCACQGGYSFDGTRCVDIDECADPTLSLCASDARCENSVGSHACICNAGFTGDGYDCIDVDECASASLNECDVHASCTNTTGSYSCACREGFMGSGVSCEDVDECARGTHGCGNNEVCVNRFGLANDCVCAPGFSRSPEGQCQPGCGNGERTPGEACDDGNVEDGDGCSARCEVEPGWACWESELGVSLCERTCGDGLVHAPVEECDDGDANSDTARDACRTSCRRANCGDGVLDSGEVCDDGAANSDELPDRCRPGTCRPASCGDGVVDTGERCDPGGGSRAPGDCVERCAELVDAGPGASPADGGCGCRVGVRSSARESLLALIALALLLLRRRSLRRRVNPEA